MFCTAFTEIRHWALVLGWQHIQIFAAVQQMQFVQLKWFSHTPELQTVVLKIGKLIQDHEKYSEEFWRRCAEDVCLCRALSCLALVLQPVGRLKHYWLWNGWQDSEIKVSCVTNPGIKQNGVFSQLSYFTERWVTNESKNVIMLHISATRRN